MATQSSTLAWKIPWTEEPGRLQSLGSLGVGHDWATSLSLFTFMHWRRKWKPTPVFLPGESQGRGSLVACRLWDRRVGHDWSNLVAAAAAGNNAHTIKHGPCLLWSQGPPSPVLQPSAPPATFPHSPSSLPIWERWFTSQDLSRLKWAGVGRRGGSETKGKKWVSFWALPLKQEGDLGHTSFSTWLAADDAIPAARGRGGGRQQKQHLSPCRQADQEQPGTRPHQTSKWGLSLHRLQAPETYAWHSFPLFHCFLSQLTHKSLESRNHAKCPHRAHSHHSTGTEVVWSKGNCWWRLLKIFWFHNEHSVAYTMKNKHTEK